MATMGQCITFGDMASGEPERKRPAPVQVQQLPEEVIYCSILARLPFRTLVRLAGVCKAWRDLILRDATFAAMQAQSPSPISAGLARFHDGVFQVFAAAADADMAPRDARLSFLPVAAGHRLELCACTGGLLCLAAMDAGGWPRTLFVCNPATREFHVVPWAGQRCAVGLAYDPSAAARYDLVAAIQHGTIDNFCYFYRFSSAAAAGFGWRESQWKLPLAPYEGLSSTKAPAYAGGRLHWLTSQARVVWHDVAGDTCGMVAPPGGRQLKGNWDIGVVRGRVRLACAGSSHAGLAVWELAGNGGAARWELVHWRSWSRVPDVVRLLPDLRLFMRSVVPAGMDLVGDEAVGLALRAAREVVVEGRTVQVWRRELLRYDPSTGATAAAVELTGKEVHDDFGMVFGYHSSMAPLPELNLAAA